MKKEKARILVAKMGDKEKGWIPSIDRMEKERKYLLPFARKAGYDDVIVIPVQLQLEVRVL